MSGRYTPPGKDQPVDLVPKSFDPFNLRGAADKAVNGIPRTPMEKLARGMKNHPGLKALREGILKRAAEEVDG